MTKTNRALLPPRCVVSLVVLLSACTAEPPRDKDGRPITVGTYRIRTYPKGAQVYVDGELAADTTPATLILEGGEHHVRIQHPGAKEAFESDVWVAAGKARVLDTRIPSPEPSSVTVTTEVDGAVVRINGYRRGLTPLEAMPVNAGPVRVSITAPDGRVGTATASLDYGQNLELSVRLPEAMTETSTRTRRGRINIVLEPEGWIEDRDGRRIGATPLRNFDVIPGLHRFTLRTETHRREVEIFVEAGRQTVYRYRLGAKDRLPEPAPR